ncbi:MAG TPA: AAA family ATPase [Pseudonocardia sp.]|uniref:AAA family ATPase n=1 Tax=Pseudonocardia sp. TaxID=60912 RepID=UPI002C8A2014|nr:AAA family ATPase [Pseudonocardia sp.]HTF52443.1 AAA family ATPase [Pseudonocardia sp.]
MNPAPPIIGLRREREVLTVALDTGRHVVIEGAPGTGKSTLLRSIARETGQEVVFVEGNAELTPARLIGAYDPSQVLSEGYLPASFLDGPLLTAMRGGGLLYLEELNRVPEETLNVLITVLTEGEIAVPRLGTVYAGDKFRLIAAMNPFDAVGTARVSQAIADRMCRVVLGYQDEAAERAITTAMTGTNGRVVELSVGLTRATREHRDVRMGSSVRGAIDLVHLLTGLTSLRRETGMARDTARDAAYAALSGRIRVADGVDRTAESVIDELLEALWPADQPEPPGPAPEPPDESAEQPPGGQGKGNGLPSAPEAGFQRRSRPRRDQSGRTSGRAELAARHEAFAKVSPKAGELDEDAFNAALAADPDAAAALLADLARATDRELRAAARRLAGRVFIQLGRTGPTRSRGTRRLGPGRTGEGDLDLERTLDQWSGRWPPSSDELVTRSWTAHRKAVCLLVDSSGSMSGLAVALAAVAAAGVVLAGAGSGGRRLETSVLAFSEEVQVLGPQGVHRQAEDLVADLVSLRGHGMTDLAGALREASRQLARAAADERIVVLLSDCLHTTGADPATALDGIDRLHVLCPLPSQEATRAASALATRGGGQCQPVRRLTDIAPALSRVLAMS